MPEFDAILKGWSATQNPSGGLSLRGEIYADRAVRFLDGTIVRTSPVELIFNGIATTRSGTRYKLELSNEPA